MKKHTPNPNHYVDNIQLYKDVKAWKETYEEKPMMPDSIAIAIMAIAEGLLKRYNFSGYSENWKQDMLSDGIEDCVKGLHNFDPDRSENVYGYINQTCWYAFIRRITTEKKASATSYRFFALNIMDELSKEVEINEDFISDMHSKISEYEDTARARPRVRAKGVNLEDILGDLL